MNRLLSISAFLLIVSAVPAFATGIWPGDTMPPLTDDWAPRTTDPVTFDIDADTQAMLNTLYLTDNTDSSPVPPLGGTYMIQSFFDIFFDLQLEENLYTPTSPGQIEFSITCISDEGDTRTFNNELLRVGTNEGGFELFITDDIILRESPTIASTGQTVITDVGGGMYQIDSFFDVFTELSIDGGQTWTPGDQPMQLVLYPEPATVLLLGLGGIALLRKRRT
jgi:hypothetical protein